MLTERLTVGQQLKTWRQSRRLSQLELALAAEVSQRHISFLENGRANPSRIMLLNLAERLDIPLRDRNPLLVAAGYAPEYTNTPLDDPSLGAAKAAIDLVLEGHEPFPALAVDRYWNIIAANSGVSMLITGIDPGLLEAPVNALRISLHPQGIAPRIENLAQWRDHLLLRLVRQVQHAGDPVLSDLYAELKTYPWPGNTESPDHYFGDFAIPLRLRTESGILSFLSTTTIFGAVHDITLDELAIESFYPADDMTARMFAAH